MAFSFAAGRKSIKPFETTSSTMPQHVKPVPNMYRTFNTDRSPTKLNFPKLRNTAAISRSPLKFTTIDVAPKRQSSVAPRVPFRSTVTQLAGEK
jgi:hypothetical protein